MPFRKSRSEKVLEAADEFASVAASALSSVKEKVAPVVEHALDQTAPAREKVKEAASPATDKLSEQVDKAAASPAADKLSARVDQAKEAAAPATAAFAAKVDSLPSKKDAKKQVKTARKEVKSQAASAKKDAKIKVAAAVAAAAPVAEKLQDKVSELNDSAAPAKKRFGLFGSSAKAKVAEATAPAREKVAASAAGERVSQAAGLTRDDVQGLFSQEWMPRIQDAIATAGAATTAAVAKLPEPAQDAVAKVAPSVVKRKKRGGLLIAVGVLALAGAGALYYSNQQKKSATSPWQNADGPVDDADFGGAAGAGDFGDQVAFADAPVAPAAGSGSSAFSGATRAQDLVGDVQDHAEDALNGTRRGRHSAN